MPVKFTEVFPSRRASDNREGSDDSELSWFAEGSDVRLDIAAAAPSVVPLVYENRMLRRIDYDPVGPGQWDVTAQYVSAEQHEQNRKLEPGEFRFTFDTSGGQAHLTHSPAGKWRKYPASGAAEAPDYQGAINFNAGKVEGVDIGIGSLKLVLTYKFPQGVITNAYLQLLKALAYKRNAAIWFGFQPGEILHLGATGGDGSNAPAEITYHFAADENLTDLQYGSITGVAKEGHDYLWIATAPEVDSTTKWQRPKPIGVYVHTMYPKVDYGLFQLSF